MRYIGLAPKGKIQAIVPGRKRRSVGAGVNFCFSQMELVDAVVEEDAAESIDSFLL